MGFFRRTAAALAAVLTLATPVHAESPGDVADTPPPPSGPPAPAYQQLSTDSNVLTPSLETAADIDAFLARTPLAGLGADFIRAEAETGVNARFLVGITWVENNSGASYLAQTQHNLFSFVGDGPGGWASYPSFQNSIQTSAAYIGKEYARPGGIHYRGGTIAAISSVYASDSGWGVKVARAANFIGPSQGAPFAGTVHLAAVADGHLTLHVANQGYVPWDAALGAQLLVHYRWAHRGQSVTGVVSVAAPALRSGGEADLAVPGVVQPDAGSWRLDVFAELAGPGWAADLGGGARDSLPLSLGGSSNSPDDQLIRDRPPAR
ncbi:MAG: hypothetical protein E6I85_11070 [Chloroflexi bacterium]|nr:MAG: hypothetical protein E6I85_11070 [Chloroflexota bacterium]